MTKVGAVLGKYYILKVHEKIYIVFQRFEMSYDLIVDVAWQTKVSHRTPMDI